MWSVAGKSQSILTCTLQRRAIERILLPAVFSTEVTVRAFSRSSSDGGKNKKFSPRRRPAANYRPTKPRGKKLKFGGATFGEEQDHLVLHQRNKGRPTQLSKERRDEEDLPDDDPDGLTAEFGPKLAEAYRALRREQDVYKGQRQTADDMLRDMDYLSAPEGSTEDLAYERRALSMECETDEEREKFLKDVDDLIERQTVDDLDPDEILEPEELASDEELEKKWAQGEAENPDYDPDDPLTGINPNQKAFGEWGELVIRVDRNIKLWRGGRIQSYRALVIGGNLNGCGGFGTGKGQDPQTAVLAASRHCKRNIFFLDRYQQNSLFQNLVGKSNSCKVVIRATHRGLRGNPLINEILKYFGVANASTRCVQGNRSQYNVVRATFKALMTHETMEDLAYKTGRRLVSISRGRRLGL